MMTKLLFIVLMSLAGAIGAFAQARAVATPEARSAILERAREIIAEEPVAELDQFRSQKDPFNPPETDLKDLVVDTSIRPKDTAPKLASDTDILQTLLSVVNPTGAVELGGEPYLLFGEKRLKVGDRYAVTKDGVDYTVTINSIEPNRFSIRYNSQVLFRQIK